jgi:anti-anti-sigma factor
MEVILNYYSNKATIKVIGMITTENAYMFQEKLDEVKKSKANLLELDFSSCRIICSTGIGKLMVFYKDFTSIDGKVEIISCSTTVYELFTTIKLNQIINISK